MSSERTRAEKLEHYRQRLLSPRSEREARMAVRLYNLLLRATPHESAVPNTNTPATDDTE